jgi:HTH-type transcriptional regulator/antitoxin HigA
MDAAKAALRKLATHPKEAYHLARVLTQYGIRFVVIEPLPGVKIDGAAMWDEIGPIIAISIRHDRIDGFWFTLMHEVEHIKNQDPISVDAGMVDAVHGITISLVNDVAEDRANTGAANSLISAAELDSFIRRVGPLYSKERIMQFSNRMKIHPGIVVGQLQHKGELGYSALRNQLVKIREHVISTALTDGWGRMVPAM